MRPPSPMVFVYAAILALTLAGSAAIYAHAEDVPAPAMKHAAGGMTGMSPMQHSMMGGMERMKKMKSTGDTDRDFATLMKMHHQQALDMAKVQITHGKSPKLKAMASKMIKDQQAEIVQLEKWLASNK